MTIANTAREDSTRRQAPQDIFDTGAVHFRTRGFEHRVGSVEAVKIRRRATLGEDNKIPGCSAPDLQHGFAIANIHLIKEPVAAQEIILACEIIEIPLKAIHPVHVFEGVGHGVLPQRH